MLPGTSKNMKGELATNPSDILLAKPMKQSSLARSALTKYTYRFGYEFRCLGGGYEVILDETHLSVGAIYG